MIAQKQNKLAELVILKAYERNPAAALEAMAKLAITAGNKKFLDAFKDLFDQTMRKNPGDQMTLTALACVR